MSDPIGNLFDVLWSVASSGVPPMLALAMFRPVDTDEELVTRCQRGDRLAFGDLVHRYQDRIYSVCLRWLGDGSVAEDVAQDVFLSAWRAVGTFRSEARFDTWLRRIAVNKCKNKRLHRQRRAYDRHESVDDDHEEDDRPKLQLVHGGRGPEGGVDRSQASALIQEALDRLDEDQRAIIIFRDMEDLSYDEIADLLEVPRGTVKSRLHRARCALTEVLAHRIGPKDVF